MKRSSLALWALSFVACAPDKDPLYGLLDSGSAADAATVHDGAAPDTTDASHPEDAGPELDGGARDLDASFSDAGSDAATDTATDAAADAGSDAGLLDAGADAAASDLDAGPDASGEVVPGDAAADTGGPSEFDAGSDADGGTACVAQTRDVALAYKPVDLIVALDTSGSMASYICNLANNLTALANGVGPSTRVVSLYELGILEIMLASLCGSGDPLASTELAADTARYRHLVTPIDSWSALSVMLGQYGAYESFLRADAQTHFLVVTDDNSNLLGATFKTQMEQKLGHGFVFHSVVADGLNGCLGASTGTEYLSLSDTTGGAKQAICGTNWDQLSTQLNAAASGTSSATCAFTLPSPPGGQPLDPLTVNLRFRPPSAAETDLPKATNSGACGSAQAWFFDQTLSPTQIELCPAACSAVKAGGTLRVAYGCASVEL